MVAPVRDIAMYAPDSLDQWEFATQMITDCGIKMEGEEINLDATVLSLSTKEVKKLMLDPQHVDMHRTILVYVEEAQVELYCLMDPLETYSGCDEIREAAGLKEGEVSTCW